MKRRLRIAMLAHSTNPRGGVVHAMQLSEALADLGHEVVLHAPDASGRGFFRAPRCGSRCIPVAPAETGMTAMVEQRIADYVRYFESADIKGFDLYHAHDGISANALATLRERGLIAGFLRTVHHVDDFADPRLMALQARSIDMAERLFTVSLLWRDHFARMGRSTTLVGNGVDCRRFTPQGDASDTALGTHLALPPGPVFLAVGGIEARKNTLHILRGFSQVLAVRPDARLLIAGGVSLLDHGSYQREFSAELQGDTRLAAAVRILGGVADADMPALFRLADALVFPSVKEGFGLVVLEAMASGTPVVLSSIAPFTEFVPDDGAIWCDPAHPGSIADGMLAALTAPVARRCIDVGLRVARAHGWNRTAAAHLADYLDLAAREAVHA